MTTAHDHALECAKAVHETNKKTATFTFPITDDNDRQTGEKIVVTVVKTTDKTTVEKSMRKLAEQATIQFYGPGGPCPACGGTGRQ